MVNHSNISKSLWSLCVLLVFTVWGVNVHAGVMPNSVIPDLYVSYAQPTYTPASGSTPGVFNLTNGYAKYLDISSDIADRIDLDAPGLGENFGDGVSGDTFADFSLVAFANNLEDSNNSNDSLLGGSFEIVGRDPNVASGVDSDVVLLKGTLEEMEQTVMGSGTIKAVSLRFQASLSEGILKPYFGESIVLSIGMSRMDMPTYFMLFGAQANLGRPVPEPNSLAIWLVGSLTLIRRRHRSRA